MAHLKKCSCKACRKGLHTKAGGFTARAAQRKDRKTVKEALKKGTRTDPGDRRNRATDRPERQALEKPEFVGAPGEIEIPGNTHTHLSRSVYTLSHGRRPAARRTANFLPSMPT